MAQGSIEMKKTAAPACRKVMIQSCEKIGMCLSRDKVNKVDRGISLTTNTGRGGVVLLSLFLLSGNGGFFRGMKV